MPNANQMTELHQMLMFCRPAGSKTERAFIKQYIDDLGCEIDGCGNRYKRIGTAPVMWSCHTDTVHRCGGLQEVVRDQFDCFSLVKRKNKNNKALRRWNGTCLGADDTAGVWLMRHMIKREIEGLYIFHRGEEHGGIGSRYITKKTPELVKDIQFAIALDRKGKNDVITHQINRCCSQAFAGSLAASLNKHEGFAYVPDNSGIFTDTALYTDLIGECSNLSVGYYAQHSSQEIQDGTHIAALLEALCAANWRDWKQERKPGERNDDVQKMFDESWNNWISGKGNGKFYDLEKGTVVPFGSAAHANKSNTKLLYGRRVLDDDTSGADGGNGFAAYGEENHLLGLIRRHPEAIEQCLRDYGISEDEIYGYIREVY